MENGVLLLNRNFLALEVTSWRRALALVFRGRAAVVDEDSRTHDFTDWLTLSQTIEESPTGFVHTPRLRIAIPEVVALKVFGGAPRRGIPFTRRNILLHYNHCCCYCGKLLPAGNLNLDHIVPRSRGGTTDWANTVPTCIPCNSRKGNRLPKEAGMSLRVKPTRPNGDSRAVFTARGVLKDSWRRFIANGHFNGHSNGANKKT